MISGNLQPDSSKRVEELSPTSEKQKKFLVITLETGRLEIAEKIIEESNPLYQHYVHFSKQHGYNFEFIERGNINLIDINKISSRILNFDKQKIIDINQGELENVIKEVSGEERKLEILETIFNIYDSVQYVDPSDPLTWPEGTKEEQIGDGRAIDEMYEAILQSFDLDHDGQLIYRDTRVPTGFKPEDLRDALHEAYSPPRSTGRKKQFKFWRDEGGKLISIVKKLAEGHFAKAYLFFSIDESLAGVFKSARRKVKDKGQIVDSDSIREMTRSDVKRDFEMLQKVHEKGTVWGVQAPPRVCKALKIMPKAKIEEGSTETQIKERFGYIGLRYDGDYSTLIRQGGRPLESALIEFHQLLGGLKNLADQNILLGDIKLENILCRKTETIQLVHTSDLGGSCQVDVSEEDNTTETLKTLIAGHGTRAATPSYTTLKDLNQSVEFADNHQRSELIEHEKKRDVFSMGVVLFRALEGKFPFPIVNQFIQPADENGLPRTLEFDRTDVPEELKTLIQAMLHPDSSQRPTAAEAYATYDAWIKERSPELHQKIHEEMASSGYLV